MDLRMSRFGPGSRRARIALVVVMVTSALLAVPSAARADSEDRELEAERWRQLAMLVADNNRRIDGLNADIHVATSKLETLAVEIAETQAKLEVTRAEANRLRAIVRGRAAFIYRQAHAPQLAVGEIADARDVASGSKYAESATRVDTSKVNALAAIVETLDAQRKSLDTQRGQAESQRQRLELAREGLRSLGDKQKKLLDDAGAVTLMGSPSLTAEEVTAWFLGTRRKFQLSEGTTMTDLVRLFYEEGKVVNVKPDVAFAQAIIETGSFGHAADNNYSGIGACDSCDGKQPGFPTARDGVRGQVQLLRAYADKTVTAADLKNPPSPTIWGTGDGAASRFETFSHKGRAPTWNAMGAGNWATDPNYSYKVLGVYFDIVTWAAKKV